MYYEFKGPALKPDFCFRDNRIDIGKKEYFYDDITNITISYKPTRTTNGVITFVHKRKNIVIAFRKDDEQEIYKAIKEVSTLLYKNDISYDENHDDENAMATKLYDYCIDHGTGKGLNRKWGIKHFTLIVNNLMPNEKVAFVFIGLNNYKSATKHEGNFACAITDNRILLAQQKVIGETVKSINWNNVNDITLQKGALLGIVEIDTFKERFNIGVDRTQAQNIYNETYRIYDLLKRKEEKKQYAHPKTELVKEDPFEQLKKLKELLDMGILTQDEFDAKKKQILNI